MSTPRTFLILVLLTAAGCKTTSSSQDDKTAPTSSAAAAEPQPTPSAKPVPTAASAQASSSTPLKTSTQPETQTLSGSDVFRLNCQGCHGPGGKGTAQAPALSQVTRDLAAGKREAELVRRLSSGGKMMPAFSYLADGEVKALLGYLRTLGGGAAAPVVAAPVKLSGTDLGKRLYQGNCASCHAPGRAAAAGMTCQPNSLVGATERFKKSEVMNLLNVGVGPMPSFGHLTAEEREALWVYLGTLTDKDGKKPAGPTCPMVQLAMQGKPTGGMMHGRGGMMGPGMMGRGMMGRTMMGRGPMMRHGTGCPMLGSDGESAAADKKLPPCCQ